jgi:hypothetical protein
MAWIHLAQDEFKKRAVVNPANNPQILFAFAVQDKINWVRFGHDSSPFLHVTRILKWPTKHCTSRITCIVPTPYPSLPFGYT